MRMAELKGWRAVRVPRWRSMTPSRLAVMRPTSTLAVVVLSVMMLKLARLVVPTSMRPRQVLETQTSGLAFANH